MYDVLQHQHQAAHFSIRILIEDFNSDEISFGFKVEVGVELEVGGNSARV